MKTNLFLFIIIISLTNLLAQTTGKISGLVNDDNGEPLVGVNVLIEGQLMGAATDVDGYYAILNVRSGVYALHFEFIGYQTQIIREVSVSADKTININTNLKTATLESTEAVVVIAEKPLVEFNETSSISTMSSKDIAKLPVQSLDELVNLQAGVVDGHFRGGRIGEVQYQVDGVSVNNPYNNSSTLQLDRSVIEEVQVISGTFDAKYGQAMSGVVNAVLKSGSNNFEWSGELLTGDYITGDDGRYPNNQDYSPFGIQNYQLSLSGPSGLPNTTFFVSSRFFQNDGFLFGEKKYTPFDTSAIATGNGDRVPMSDNFEYNGQFKLSNKSLAGISISYQALGSYGEGHTYNHTFRLNPDGIKTQTSKSLVHGVDWVHQLSEKMFYKLSLRQNYFYYSDFKYANLYDPRYLQAKGSKGFANLEDGALIHGVDLGRFKQETNAGIVKFDYTWQAHKMHLLESGLELQVSKILFGNPGYLRETTMNGIQQLLPFETFENDLGLETYYPYQGAFYIQDRIEWDDLVVRAGFRIDYFDARATIPSDLQNPANSISGAPESRPQDTSEKTRISPRLGVSFPLSESASLYFSYGHFVQMPGLSLLYNNANYNVLDELQAGGISYGVLGNPDLKPEFTTQYEFGLKQALNAFLGYEFTVFYKDIRDLLGVEFVSTYSAADYAHFTNIDFGSVYGFTLSLEQRPIGPISTSLDYTMQVSRGNSSNPDETANRAAGGLDSRPRDIAFNWDQLHTINAMAVLSVADNYSISAILKIGSGQPYTPQLGRLGLSGAQETNSGRKENFALLDLRAEKHFTLAIVKVSVFMRVFNVFNEHFVNGFVFGTSGSVDYSPFPFIDRVQLSNPDRFHPPRRIEIGFTFWGL